MAKFSGARKASKSTKSASSFNYQKGMQRGGTGANKSQFVKKDATQRYASRYGDKAASQRFGGSTPSPAQGGNSFFSNIKDQAAGYAQNYAQNKMDSAAQKSQQRQQEQQQKAQADAQRKADEEEKIRQKTQEEEEKLQRKIEKLEAKRDKKIERIKSGPHGIYSLFTANWMLIPLGLFDAGLGAIIPFLGDVISFFINLIWWSIACILMLDLSSWFKIVIFLLVDCVVGLLPGFGDLADLAPEILGMVLPFGPPSILAKAYERKKPHMISRINDRYNRKIKAAQSDEKKNLKNAIKRIHGHMAGVCVDAQKIFFFITFVAIGLMGPFGLNLFSFSSGRGIYVLLGLVCVVLVLLELMGVISMKHVLSLIGFILLNMLFDYLWMGSTFLNTFIGPGSAVVLVLFIVLSVVYLLHAVDIIGRKGMFAIFIILALLLVIPYLLGYVTGVQFEQDFQEAQVQQEARYQEMNILQQIKTWVAGQNLLGAGERIDNGIMEDTTEYVGVAIEGVDVLTEEVRAGQPVRLTVDYSTNSFEEIELITMCSIDAINAQAQVDPAVVFASELRSPRVKCTFENLPVGYYSITTTGLYSYTSTTRIPLSFMEENFAYGLEDPEQYITESTTEFGAPITSSGPLLLSASNARKNGKLVLQQPLLVDANNPNGFPTTLKIQFELMNPAPVEGEGIQRVDGLHISLPAGLYFENCNFDAGSILDYEVVDGRWEVDAQEQFKGIDNYQTLSCDLLIHENYLDDFIPSIGEPWSVHTIILDVDYTYQIKKFDTFARVTGVAN